MKKYIKGFIPGFLTAVILMGLIGSAFATVAQKQANLNYSDIKITLDGKSVSPLDANGNYAEPFAIDGVTYLPVRAVANAFGADVKWDSLQNTVALTSASADKPTTTSYKDGLRATKIYKDLEDAAEYAEFIYKDTSLTITYMYAGIPSSETTKNMQESLDYLLPTYVDMISEISKELQLLKKECNTSGVLLDLNDNAEKYLVKAYDLSDALETMIKSAINYAKNTSNANNSAYTTNADSVCAKLVALKGDASLAYTLTYYRLLGWLNKGME